MAEYIEREKIGLTDFEIAMCNGDYKEAFKMLLEKIESIPAADVLPRDEAIKMGAELAAMHGSDATSQQLEEAYLKGVEYDMTRRDVRPVVRGRWIETKTGFHCSACKTKAKGTKDGALLSNFCPNCGADMREES